MFMIFTGRKIMSHDTSHWNLECLLCGIKQERRLSALLQKQLELSHEEIQALMAALKRLGVKRVEVVASETGLSDERGRCCTFLLREAIGNALILCLQNLF